MKPFPKYTKHKPDSGLFIDHLCGKNIMPVAPMVEYNIDNQHIQTITTDIIGKPWVDWGNERGNQKIFLDNFINVWHFLGYDFVRVERSLPFNERRLIGQDRSWVDQRRGAIQNWADFEQYPWPKISEFDFFAFEYINNNLPEGMGLIVSHAGGIFEHLSQIMSFEGLCYALHDQRDLVQAITAKIGKLETDFYRNILDLDNVIALWPGDDMGFRSATMISPQELRQFILPWHKRFSRMAHDRNIPYFLHSCGQIGDIMDDLIDDIKIDGKHSFEDAIVPVEEFYRLYGQKIAVLGGLDINILSSGSPQEIRSRTRNIIKKCNAYGRFGIGSGNSIPDYIPIENYLAMVTERHKLASEL